MSTSEMEMGMLGRLRCSAMEQIQRFRAVMSRFSPWILVLPALAIVSTTGGFYRYLWPDRPPHAYATLGAALAVTAFVTAATCWVLRGDFFHRWLIYLTGCLWCRAINLTGTELGTAVAIAILMWYALVKYEEMRPYLQNRLLVNLLVGSLLCQCLPWLLTADVSVWVMRLGISPYRVNNAMMLAGRMMLLASVIVSEALCRFGRISAAEGIPDEYSAVLPFTATHAVSEPAGLSARKAA